MMSASKRIKDNETWEIGSTNVFADLDMPDADEKLAKAELTLKINEIIKHKHLGQKEAAKLLGVDQSKISLLNRGRLSNFSIERLVKYLTLLDRDIEIVVKKTKRRQALHGRLSVVYA
jgi:predicted XRE-type DNA-binding protein